MVGGQGENENRVQYGSLQSDRRTEFLQDGDEIELAMEIIEATLTLEIAETEAKAEATGAINE